MLLESHEWMPEILELHHEELAGLWQLRTTIQRSPDWIIADLAGLDSRIRAHADGLVVAGENAWQLLFEKLSAADSCEAFAAVWPLLCQPDSEEIYQHISRVLAKSEWSAIGGIAEGILLARGVAIQRIMPGDRSAGGKAPVDWLCSYCSILTGSPEGTFHRDLTTGLISDEDPELRLYGWRLAGIQRQVLSRELWVKGLLDEDRNTRNAAWEAAVRSGQTWLVENCRAIIDREDDPHINACLTLGLLGQPEDLSRIRKILAHQNLGEARFVAAGSFANPAILPDIVKMLDSQDPRDAIAAGKVWFKMTGIGIPSGDRVTLPPEDGSVPDDFDQEFLDVVETPDRNSAEKLLKEHSGKWLGQKWLYRGVPVEDIHSQPVSNQLDLETRWERSIRNAHYEKDGESFLDLISLQ